MTSVYRKTRTTDAENQPLAAGHVDLLVFCVLRAIIPGRGSAVGESDVVGPDFESRPIRRFRPRRRPPRRTRSSCSFRQDDLDAGIKNPRESATRRSCSASSAPATLRRRTKSG